MSYNRNAWVGEWQERQLARGRCTRACGNETAINPNTGRHFWLCRECRIQVANRVRAKREIKRAA